MRTIVLLTLGLALALSSGCSVCAPGFLDDYATVGGKWQRSDPTQGRVGSIFSDPGSTIAAGTPGQRVVDSHPAGVESEYFGEAYTDGYQGPYQDAEVEYGSEYDGEYYEFNDEMSHSDLAPEMYEGNGDSLQFDDQILTLDNEW